MSVPAVRRIVVGVDDSAESAAAFRWACREAALRGSEVHAVHVRESKCHGGPSYAVPSLASHSDDIDIEDLWRSLCSAQGADVPVRTEVVDGLAARALLDRCAGADMLILGTSSDMCGPLRSAGPVIRACLRRAPCPVVIISAAQDPGPSHEPALRDEEAPLDVALSQGTAVPIGAAVPVGV